MASHDSVTGPNVHTPYRQVFADDAARLADAAAYVATDLYKKAYQVDTAQNYTLTAIGPTAWTADAGGGGGGGTVAQWAVVQSNGAGAPTIFGAGGGGVWDSAAGNEAGRVDYTLSAAAQAAQAVNLSYLAMPLLVAQRVILDLTPNTQFSTRLFGFADSLPVDGSVSVRAEFVP